MVRAFVKHLVLSMSGYSLKDPGKIHIRAEPQLGLRSMHRFLLGAIDPLTILEAFLWLPKALAPTACLFL